MTEVLKNLTVDLSRKGGLRPIFAVENDTGARKLKIKITDDGAPYKLDTGTVATLNYKRADEVSGAILAVIEEDGALVTLNSLILGAPGQVVCSLSLSDENKNKITSSEFCLDVGKELYSGEALDTAPEYGLLLDTMARLSEIENEESARVIAEADRVTAEKARDAAREAFEAEANAKIAQQDGKISAQDATIESRLSAQDAAISKQDGKISAQDATIESRLAAQDSKLAGRLGEEGVVTLKASKWSSQYEQKVAAGDAGDEDIVIFYPDTANDREVCGLYGVFVSSESENGYFTVSARAKPLSDISLRYYVIRGRLSEVI